MRTAACLSIVFAFFAAGCRCSTAHERGRWQTSVSEQHYLLTDTETGRVWRFTDDANGGHWDLLPPLPGAAK